MSVGQPGAGSWGSGSEIGPRESITGASAAGQEWKP